MSHGMFCTPTVWHMPKMHYTIFVVGILPTFGPCWVNFYGAPRNVRVLENLDDLNEGIGEGAAYR